ncbi:uncharacterized protein ColSpa_01871 [Colletotrichum spaethianum]|uniref:Uncharacterized protein n=1 Tax=Colletotrichum spaethianum TaxID=700344 RepID=A0AA37NWU9_9PEZI|nr:uncharacterized protein ColSpa_01871 [Colletotrichum spaethianum]GKT41690.1 hypothetical protein ColSpa_01871 [Colletotrichum spaethianum]
MANASASLFISADGSYAGITASAKVSSDISFGYSVESSHRETSESKVDVGSTFVAQLFVFPNLKCKVIKQQRIVYTIDEPIWKMKIPGGDMNWGPRQIAVGRLDGNYPRISPVPTKGKGLGEIAQLCPIFTFVDGSEDEMNTLISRTDWEKWSLYDSYPWTEPTNQAITVAVPDNKCTFRPMNDG